MARHKKQKSYKPRLNLSPEIKKDIFVIFLLLIAFLSLLSIFNLTGNLGQSLNIFWKMVFGWGWFLWPFILILISFLIINQEKYENKTTKWIGLLLFILTFYGLLELCIKEKTLAIAQSGIGGGLIGYLVGMPLYKILNFWGALIILLGLFVISILIFFETSIHSIIEKIHLPKLNFFYNLKEKFKKTPEEITQNIGFESKELENNDEWDEEDEYKIKKREKFHKNILQNKQERKINKKLSKIDIPLSLLNSKETNPYSGDIKKNQEIIKNTLGYFGISVEMDEVFIGPTVTQYTFKPASGVKISQILTLNNDLALALAAHPIRIEAPIPGKSLIGIEVPNKKSALVSLKEILSSEIFKHRNSNLSMILGKDVAGEALLADLDKMPHMLVAGATNSGKTVCLNTFIVSMLYQNQPDELKLMLIDPKQVEMIQYDNIPHLICPVITEAKKTINPLRWAVKEMEERFGLLSKASKRNIASYNLSNPTKKIPYLVIVIDELADLMTTAPADIEPPIIRLAQKARAVGIHLILATQKPSVNVLTGLIKSNITARIAFKVASLTDSRTILDFSGAEKLLGNGDMLYKGPLFSKPVRIQGAFLSDEEINNVVTYLKKQGKPDYNEEITATQSLSNNINFGNFDNDGDELLEEAKEIVINAGKASSSYLQRKLRIGYARAARLLDLLEEQGIVGPQEGSKAREVYSSPEELQADKILTEANEDEELNELEYSHKELKKLEKEYEKKYKSKNEKENDDDENEDTEEK